jgi:gamma-glutamylcysteine synthetase
VEEGGNHLHLDLEV